MDSMRELIIREHKDEGYADFNYKWGDNDAAKYPKYEDWLRHLSDEDLLAAHDRVHDYVNSID